jgi:Fe2+-dicitrate sensor, membrane component
MSREVQAGKWFARMRASDAAADRAKFNAWMADPENAEAYAEAERRWAALDVNVAGRIRARAPRPSGSNRLRWATAVLLVVMLTVGGAWYAGRAGTGAQMATRSVEGETVRLTDGTLIELLDGAKIETRFSERGREVVMTGGRARFTVAHDASRPFRVVADGSEIVALGTIFEVDLRRPNPSIRLVSGSVDVRATAPGGRTVRLKPGDTVEVRGSEPLHLARGSAALSTPDTAMTLPVANIPPTPRVVADKLPLSEVTDQANRVNSKPIRLADPALGSLEVTGRFDVTDSASLARKLSAVFGLSAQESDGAIILSRKKAGG